MENEGFKDIFHEYTKDFSLTLCIIWRQMLQNLVENYR